MTSDAARRGPGIPVMRPILPRADSVLPLLREMDDRRVYANDGPLVRRLEAELADHLGVASRRVVVCSSATLGLQGAFALSPVEEFVAPAFTFPATLLSVHHAGRRLRLADIDPRSWQVAPGPAAPHPSTGLVRVLPFGAPLELPRSSVWKHVVIDAAASLGGDLEGLGDLPDGWTVVLSLHATKVLGVGEGGVAVFGSDQRAAAFRSWINFGFDHSRDSQALGSNAKMPEAMAAYGLAALAAWTVERDEWCAARRLAREVDDRLGIASVATAYAGVNPYWVVRLPSAAARSRAEELLDEHGIGSRRWWGAGCHTMPAFAELAREPLPVTDDVAATTLGLPMFRGLSRADVARIAVVVEQALRTGAG